MSIYNKTWISVSPLDGEGYSYIRLTDIDKITVCPSDTGPDNRRHILVQSLNETYVYHTADDVSKADKSVKEVLRLIGEAVNISNEKS